MKENKTNWFIGLVLLALLFVGLYVLEQVMPPSTMLFTILKKASFMP